MSINLTITVGGSDVRAFPSLPFTKGMNAQNALEAAYAAGSGYSFLLQYFGALGYEVTAIDGITAQQGADAATYWEFIYNGVPAQLGIDSTMLVDGDALNFTYTIYDQVQHAGSRLEAVHSAGVAARTAR